MSEAALAQRRTEPRWNVRRGLMVLLAVLCVEAGAVLGWVAYQALAAREALEDARAGVAVARDALGEVDVVAAGEALQGAATRFNDGYNRLSGPVVRSATVLPVLGDDLRTARLLAWGGREVAQSGVEVIATVDDLGGLQAFSPRDGRLPVEALEALAGPTAAAHQRLSVVAQEVDGTPVDGLLEPVAAARTEFLTEVRTVRDLVGDVADATAHVPAMLGADGPRRYLFGAQNPAELRGTGGFLGAYSVLTVSDGALDFADFVSVNDLTSLHVSQVEAPNPDFAQRYDRFGGAGFWQAINFTPDFPSAARAMEQLWARTEGTPVDGVIAVDPLAFEALLRLSGPIDVPGFGTVDADDIVEVVANEAYAEFDDNGERKELLGAVAAEALGGALRSGDVGALESARSLLEIAEQGHLKMHAREPGEQSLLVDLGIAGELRDAPGDFLSVIVNNASFTKLDYYTDRHVDYHVQLHEDGSLDGEAKVTFANSAPTEGLPAQVIGPGYHGQLEVGENRSYVSVYCDVGCDLHDADGWRVEQELGHGVVSRFVTVASGEQTEVVVQWHAPHGWNPDNDAYRLTYQAQPTLRPTTLALEVSAPPGYRVGDGGSWRGTVKGDHEITLPIKRS